MIYIKWGFIGCGEVAEIKSGPAFAEVEGSSVMAYAVGIPTPSNLSPTPT